LKNLQILSAKKSILAYTYNTRSHDKKPHISNTVKVSILNAIVIMIIVGFNDA